MNCFYCGGNTQDSVTSHTVTLKNCVVIVKDVPCTRCAQCGEVFFNDEITDKLEKIVETFRKTKTEIAVVSYTA